MVLDCATVQNWGKASERVPGQNIVVYVEDWVRGRDVELQRNCHARMRQHLPSWYLRRLVPFEMHRAGTCTLCTEHRN